MIWILLLRLEDDGRDHFSYIPLILLFVLLLVLFILLLLLLLLLLRSNPKQASLKGTISRGVRRRRKIKKHGKVGVKIVWWVSAQSPYYQQGNGR